MLSVTNISFGYNKEQLILNDFSFSLQKGAHLCIMGESGCGKSTLLKALYGLVDLNKGTIQWNGKKILGPEFHLVPGFERFKYVPQDFDLMPYTSVSENIKKHLSRFYPEESEARTKELLEVIEMEAFANEKVKHLSGGQKQRVAIARALAKEPELILLDEPFGQIDNFKKNSLRRNIFRFLKEKNISCIVATHDKNDALSFADQLIVIRDHKILVNDHPQKIYKHPKEKYIAALFDDVNEIHRNGKTNFLYPYQIKFVEDSEHKATVLQSFFKGDYWLIEVRFNKQSLFVKHDFEMKKGDAVNVSFEW